MSGNRCYAFDYEHLPPQLKKLNLSGNPFPLVYWWRLPETLEELDLSNTRYMSFPMSRLPRNLKRLNFSHNKELVFRYGHDRFPPNLEYLDMSYCSLDDRFDFCELPESLKHLDLKANNFREVDIRTLPPNLTYFDISENGVEAFSWRNSDEKRAVFESVELKLIERVCESDDRIKGYSYACDK